MHEHACRLGCLFLLAWVCSGTMLWCLSLFSTLSLSILFRPSLLFQHRSLPTVWVICLFLSSFLVSQQVRESAAKNSRVVALPNASLRVHSTEVCGSEGSSGSRHGNILFTKNRPGIPRWFPQVGFPKMPSNLKENNGKLIKGFFAWRAEFSYSLMWEL